MDLSMEPSLSASEVRLEHKPDNSQIAITYVGRLRVKIALLPLLSGTVLIKELYINDMTISLMTGGESELDDRHIPVTEGLHLMVPVLENVALRNINMVISDRDKGRSVPILLRNFNIDHVHGTYLLYIKGEGTLDANDFLVEGRIGSVADVLNRADPYPVEFNLKVADLNLTVSGTVDDPISGKGLDLRVAGEGLEVANILALFLTDIPNLGQLRLDAVITGDATAPSVPSLSITVSDRSQFEFTAEGSIANITNGEGTNIRISGSCTNKDLIRMMLSGELCVFNEVKVKGDLCKTQEGYAFEHVTAHASGCHGIEVNSDGTVFFDRLMGGPSVKEMDLRFQIFGPSTETFKPLLFDSVPNLGPVSAYARLTGPIDRLSIEDIALNIGESGPLQMEARGCIGRVRIGTAMPISEIDISVSVDANQTALLSNALDVSLPELGFLSICARVSGSQDQFQIDDLDLHTFDAHGLKVQMSGNLCFGKQKTGRYLGDVDIEVLIAAPNMGYAEPLVGARLLPNLGPVRAEAHVIGTTEVLSLENIAIKAGESGRVRVEWRGNVGKIPLLRGQLVSGLELVSSIHAKDATVLASLAGVSLPDLGPLTGTWRVVDREGGYGFDDMEILLGSTEGFHLKATGDINSVMRGAAVSLGGIDFKIEGEAPDFRTIPVIDNFDAPELGPFQLKAHMLDHEGSLDIEKFELRTGPKKNATILMEGQIYGIHNRDQIALNATFEAATQPWVEKLAQRSAPRSHRVRGTVRLAGAIDNFRIKELQVVTTDLGRLSLKANGTVKKISESYEVDAEITSESTDMSVIGSILGRSLPLLSPPAIKGRLKANANGAVFEGEVHLGSTQFKTTLSGSLNNQRPCVVAKISTPVVNLSDLGIYPNGSPEDSHPDTEAESSTESRLFSEERLSFDSLKALNLSLSLDADKVVGRNFVLNKLDLDLSSNDGRLCISPAILSYAGGYVSIDSTVDTAGPKPEITLKVIAEDIDIGVALAHLKRPLISDGELNLAANMRGIGSSCREIASTLKGELGVAIKNGRIKRDIDFLGADALDLLTALPQIREYQDLNCLAIRFMFKDGIGNSRIILLDTSNFRARGFGSVNLASETIDLVIQPKPKKDLVGKRSAVRIYGSLTAPSIRTLPFLEVARLFGEIFVPYVFLPARALGYLWYLMEYDKDEESPCLHGVTQVE